MASFLSLQHLRISSQLNSQLFIVVFFVLIGGQCVVLGVEYLPNLSGSGDACVSHIVWESDRARTAQPRLGFSL